MSASLVGSEMCIRDSPTVAGLEQLPAVKMPTDKAIVERHRARVAELKDCLLYTSDAADDM
eukprot:1032840-Alexandrium_andersonii.AAC.1